MNKNNKFPLLMLFSGVFLILLSSGVLAYINFQYGANQIMTWIENIFGPFFAVLLGGNGMYLFERILLFFVIFSVTFLVLEKVPIFKEKTGVRWIVTIAVSLLAARFGMQWDYLEAVFLPYTILGVVLTAAIPFIIYFFFVNSFEDDVDERIFFIGLRKILWVFLGVVYLGIWMSRTDEIGNLSWIYFWTAIAAFVLMFADGTIRRLMLKHDLSQLNIANRDQYEIQIRRSLHQLENDHVNGIVTDGQYRRLKKRLQHRIELIKKT